MSIWYLIVPAVAIGANAIFGKKTPPVPSAPKAAGREMVQISPIEQGGRPVGDSLPAGVPVTPKTVAFQQAVALVEIIKRGKSGPNVYNGEGGMPRVMTFKIGQKDLSQRAPVLEEKDLPPAPAGYRWFKVKDPIFYAGTRSESWTEWWTLSIPFMGRKAVIDDKTMEMLKAISEPREKRWPATGLTSRDVKPPTPPAGYGWMWISSTRNPNDPGFWNLVSSDVFSAIV